MMKRERERNENNRERKWRKMEKQRDRDDIRAIMLTTVEGKECLCVCWKERERKIGRGGK